MSLSKLFAFIILSANTIFDLLIDQNLRGLLIYQNLICWQNMEKNYNFFILYQQFFVLKIDLCRQM